MRKKKVYKKSLISAMKELILKNLTSKDPLRREILVTEQIQQDGLILQFEKRSIYIIKDKTHLEEVSELQAYVSHLNQKHYLSPRQIFIRKNFDLHRGERFFSYELVGRFYVVINKDVYTVAFKQVFKMLILQSPPPESNS